MLEGRVEVDVVPRLEGKVDAHLLQRNEVGAVRDLPLSAIEDRLPHPAALGEERVQARRLEDPVATDRGEVEDPAPDSEPHARGAVAT